jgi:hypothetical protein
MAGWAALAVALIILTGWLAALDEGSHAHFKTQVRRRRKR